MTYPDLLVNLLGGMRTQPRYRSTQPEYRMAGSGRGLAQPPALVVGPSLAEPPVMGEGGGFLPSEARIAPTVRPDPWQSLGLDVPMQSALRPPMQEIARPTAPTLRMGPYNEPPIPIRDTDTERRQVGREALLAGLGGLLLGGGQGATAAMKGYSTGAQGRLDDRFKTRVGEYEDAVRRARIGRETDEQFNRLALDQYGDDLRAYNDQENRDMREWIAGEGNRTRTAIAANREGGLQSRFEAKLPLEQAKTEATLADTQSRINDRETDNKRQETQVLSAIRQNQERLAIAMQNAITSQNRLAMDVAHKQWLQESGNMALSIRQAKLQIDQAKSGGKSPYTVAQQDAIRKNLARVEQEIAAARLVGKEPNKTKDPENWNRWREMRQAGEETARALREFYDAQADAIGMKRLGNRYVPKTGNVDMTRGAAKGSTLDQEALSVIGSMTGNPVLLPGNQVRGGSIQVGPDGVSRIVPTPPPPSRRVSPSAGARTPAPRPTPTPRPAPVATPAPSGGPVVNRAFMMPPTRPTSKPTPAPTTKPISQMTPEEKAAEFARLAAKMKGSN